MKKLILIFTLLLALMLAGCETVPGTSAPPLADSCSHADTDDNGLCDNCAGSVIVVLDFFNINDLHGKFLDSDSQPGIEELSTFLGSQTGNTVLLSSGDTWQGSSESNLTYGMLLTDWMNEMDFAAMTLGNHEFDWGTDYIRQNQALAEYPLLAINIYDRSTNALADYCQPSVVIERAGLQIGIIGAIGDCHSSISGEHNQDFYFKTGSELTALVKAEAENLRSKGADVIVYSLHDGYGDSMTIEKPLAANKISGYYDVSLSDGYVDLVFEGHTHQSYVFTDEYGVHHLQGGGENRGICYAEVSYNIANGTITEVDAEVLSNSVYKNCDEHPIADKLLEKYKEQISQGQQVLGNNQKNRNSEFLRKLVAQLYFDAGEERWGSEYDIALGGGFISIRNPYELGAGEVRYADLYSLFPFDNELVLCSIRGSDLRSKFVDSTNKNYYVYYEDLGSIDPAGTYYVIVDTYTSSYAYNRLTEIAHYDAGIYARDLLADYIAFGGLDAPAIPEDYQLTSIPELHSICAQLSPGAYSETDFFVQGKISSIVSDRYGNVYIEDADGNQLYIYGMYDRSGKRYDSMQTPPQLGDTIVLYGKLQHYVTSSGASVYEMVDATLIEA